MPTGCAFTTVPVGLASICWVALLAAASAAAFWPAAWAAAPAAAAPAALAAFSAAFCRAWSAVMAGTMLPWTSASRLMFSLGGGGLMSLAALSTTCTDFSLVVILVSM